MGNTLKIWKIGKYFIKKDLSTTCKFFVEHVFSEKRTFLNFKGFSMLLYPYKLCYKVKVHCIK